MATLASWGHQDGRGSYNHSQGKGLLIFSAFYIIIMEHADLIFDGMPEEERRIVKSLMKSDPDLITEGPEFSGKLFLGSQAVASRPDTLKAHGIKVVLQISGEETPPRFPDDFEYNCFTFGDTPTTSLAPHLPRAVDLIHTALTQDKPVFVHCAAGVSRSASLIIGYLMTFKSWDYDTALKHVTDMRPCVGPNEGFES
jgi:atypical dual specificity phosphatase